MKTFIGSALLATCLLFAVGCNGASPTATPTPTSTPTPTLAATPSPTLAAQPVATATPTIAPPGVPTPTPTGVEPTPGPQAPTSPVVIAMVSSVREVRPGQEFSVDVTLDPQGRGISGVEMEVRFDPAVFQMLDVVPGQLLGEKSDELRGIIPIVDIDDGAGTLRYADVRLEVTQPPTPSGILATMKLQVLESAPAGRTALLSITEVKIPDENIQEIHDILIGEALRIEISPEG